MLAPLGEVFLDACRQFYLRVAGRYEALVFYDQLHRYGAIRYSCFECDTDTSAGPGLFGSLAMQMDAGGPQHGTPALPGLSIYKCSQQNDAIWHWDRQMHALFCLRVLEYMFLAHPACGIDNHHVQ